jgi:hypothetical protein
MFKMKRHTLFVPHMQDVRWRLHGRSCALDETDMKQTLHYFLCRHRRKNKEGWYCEITEGLKRGQEKRQPKKEKKYIKRLYSLI